MRNRERIERVWFSSVYVDDQSLAFVLPWHELG